MKRLPPLQQLTTRRHVVQQTQAACKIRAAVFAFGKGFLSTGEYVHVQFKFEAGNGGEKRKCRAGEREGERERDGGGRNYKTLP